VKLGLEYNKVLNIRVSEEQYRKMKEQANKEGISVSSYIRSIEEQYRNSQ
jgi:predicted DNA binding CopG/RHH family protein